ncbi:Sorting nexin-13 [Nymphon striatum]|nr:Sorting nexin-13 [Nymphon striatum]
MSGSAGAWIALMLALSLSTFGVGGTITFSLCFTSTILGYEWYIGYVKSIINNGYIVDHLHRMEDDLKNDKKFPKQDRRMTGSIIIDEQLHEILQYALRDFVQNWYTAISEDEQFIHEIGKAAQEAIISFSNRSKEINWIPYITTQLVDDFASHLRLFRKTQQKLKQQLLEDSCQRSDVNTIFFTFELEMEESMSRDGICTNSDNESAFLRDITDILLFLLVSPKNFESTVCRQLLREIFIHNLILSVLETFTDPDYINQMIVWMCKDIPVTSEVFLTIIKSTDNIDELIAVQESINHEIAVQRSNDTWWLAIPILTIFVDAEVKQRLSSLHYVKKVVETKMQRLNDGLEETDSLGLPSQIDWNKWLNADQNLPDLSLDFILKNNIALSYFMDYMTSVNSQAYLFFYLNVEGYKVSAEQQLSAAHLSGTGSNGQVDLESLRQAALSIYQTCLSEEATPHISIIDNYQNDITQKVTKKLLMRVRTDPEPSDRWFDEAQSKVSRISFI